MSLDIKKQNQQRYDINAADGHIIENKAIFSQLATYAKQALQYALQQKAEASSSSTEIVAQPVPQEVRQLLDSSVFAKIEEALLNLVHSIVEAKAVFAGRLQDLVNDGLINMHQQSAALGAADTAFDAIVTGAAQQAQNEPQLPQTQADIADRANDLRDIFFNAFRGDYAAHSGSINSGAESDFIIDKTGLRNIGFNVAYNAVVTFTTIATFTRTRSISLAQAPGFFSGSSNTHTMSIPFANVSDLLPNFSNN